MKDKVSSIGEKLKILPETNEDSRCMDILRIIYDVYFNIATTFTVQEPKEYESLLCKNL